MATITTDTFLDGGVARTAGEAWTCNGGRLTIRTDTRWHANSPASMTGTLGSLSISATLGGGYTIDATAVRWVAYDAGSGNVPAIGTTVTGGTSGSSGYLLGVWASLTSAPTAVGAAMPATGFLKLREATAAFVDNDALSGIGATTNGVDVVGWIEVVHDQATAITIPRLGDFTTRGDWFQVGTTSGSANQLMQIPTNGSTTAYVPGVYVETGVASGIYEFWPSLYAGGMLTTNLGTDDRSKFVCMETNGQVRFGHNGTTTVGKVPASGLRVRIPNIFGRQCTTAARATNAIPNAAGGTRPDFATTSGGAVDIENFATDWYLNFGQPYAFRMVDSCTFDYVLLSEVATAVELSNGGTGTSQSIDSRTLNLTSCFAGGTITDWVCHRHAAGTTDHACEIVYCTGVTLTRVKSGIITFARSTGMSFQVNFSSDITINDCKSFNSGLQLSTSSDCIVNDLDHCDRYVGTTNTTGIYAIYILASCDSILVDGVTFGLGGAVANVHPYLGIFNVGQSSNIRLRNVGTRSIALSGGSSNNPEYIFLSGGNNRNVKLQRIYMTPTRTGAISTQNSDKGMTYEHVYGDMGDTMVVADLNSNVKNCGGTNTTTGQSSVYGTHFWDAFVSDTVGRVILSMNEATVETASLVTVVAGTPKFTSAGGIVMAAVNDEIIIEQDYYVLGCTALANTAPIVTGTNVTYVSGPDWGNHDIYYQIDVNDGTGWNGSWLNLTAANLSAETIDPAAGFRLKYRIVCDTASTTNLISYIRIQTTSTLAAQVANLYPLDTVPVTITVLDAANSPIQDVRVSVFRISDGLEILNADSDASGLAAGTFSEATPASIKWRCRKGSSGDSPKYVAASGVGTILDTTGFSLVVSMRENTINNA
jgi:hypothetical protein